MLFWCLLLYFSPTRAENQPQIQVLFYGSDESKAWPPPGTSWSDPPQSWPGHLKQLGSEHPRTKVDVSYKKGFPKAQDFYNNFVTKRKPVVFQKGLDEAQLEDLSLARLNQSGLAALTFIEVGRFNDKEKEAMSLRNFIKKLHEPVYTKDSLHLNLKRNVYLPRCLVCKYLTDILEETKHTIIGHVFPFPVIQDESELLTCLIDGKKEVLLVDPSESPEIESIMEIDQSPYGKASLMNSMMVDYEKYPGAAKVKNYHITILGPGDCLYIPGGLIRQSNVLSSEHSIDIRWKNEVWSPDDDCMSSISNKAPLSQFNFQAENFFGIETSLDQEMKTLKKVSRVLDWLLQSNLTEKELFARIVRDSELIPELQSWSQECSARGKEMFDLLDMNKDGKLGPSDVEEITEKSVPRILGYMEDRFADLQDIVAGQRFSKHKTLSSEDRIDMADSIMRKKRDEL